MKVGDKVEHILSRDWVLILEISKDKIVCRTKDLREISFHKFELVEINKK